MLREHLLSGQLVFTDSQEVENELTYQEFVINNKETSNRKLALILTNLYVIFDAVYAGGAKYLQIQGVNFLEISLLRFMFLTLVGYFMLKKNRINYCDLFESKQLFMDVQVRSLCAFIGATGAVIAILYLPLTLMLLICSLNSLLAALLTYVSLRRELSWLQIGLISVGYAGLALVVSVSFAGEIGNNQTRDYRIGLLWSLVASIALAITALMKGRLNEVHFSLQTIHLGITGFLLSLFGIFILNLTQPLKLPYAINKGQAIWYFLILVSLCKGISETLAALQNQLERSGVTSMLAHSSILCYFFIDIVFFKESFSSLQLAGGFLMLLAVILNGLQQVKERENI